MKAEVVFQAYLENAVANRTYERVQHFTKLRELSTVDTPITRIESDGAISLLSGEVIAHNQLVSVGGIFAPAYQGYELYCTTCDH
jgi:hypothetical protein